MEEQESVMSEGAVIRGSCIMDNMATTLLVRQGSRTFFHYFFMIIKHKLPLSMGMPFQNEAQGQGHFQRSSAGTGKMNIFPKKKSRPLHTLRGQRP